jgi:PhnB protein
VDSSATGAERDLVINATLETGDFNLRGSDRGDATTRPQARVALSLIGTDEARLCKIYDALSDGGSQDSPLEKVFWGDVFGALTDKFGINWQVNVGSALP